MQTERRDTQDGEEGQKIAHDADELRRPKPRHAWDSQHFADGE